MHIYQFEGGKSKIEVNFSKFSKSDLQLWHHYPVIWAKWFNIQMRSTVFGKNNNVYFDQFEGCESKIQIRFENLEKLIKLESRISKLVYVHIIVSTKSTCADLNFWPFFPN